MGCSTTINDTDTGVIVCRCDHLTNFAVLVVRRHEDMICTTITNLVYVYLQCPNHSYANTFSGLSRKYAMMTIVMSYLHLLIQYLYWLNHQIDLQYILWQCNKSIFASFVGVSMGMALIQNTAERIFTT